MKPCKGCPFRADALLGMWEASHYLAIAYLGSADVPLLVGTGMGCHKWNGWVNQDRAPEDSPMCGGWVRAARDTPMVHIGVIMGKIDPSELDDLDGVISTEEMAHRNGLDMDKLPPLRWRPGLEEWPDPQAWMEHIVHLRQEILSNPRLALAYVIPGSPLDCALPLEQVQQALGMTALPELP